MTPSSSSGPLAALVNTGSNSSSSSDSSSVDGHPALSTELAPTKKRNSFSHIYQQESNASSSEIEINAGFMPDGRRTPFPIGPGEQSGVLAQDGLLQPPGIDWPVHIAGLSPSDLAGQMLPGQATHAQPGTGLPAQAPDTGSVDGNLMMPLAIVNPGNLTDPAQMPPGLVLTEADKGDSRYTILPTGGVRPPLSGNPLPVGALQNQQTQSTIPNMASMSAAVPGALSQTEPMDYAVLQQGPFKPTPDATEVLTRPVVPEFAAPLSKLLKTAMNVPTSPATSSLAGATDLASTPSERDVAQIDGLRNQTMTSSLDRPSSIQAPAAPIPLSRMAGAPGWDQGLGQRILWMVDNGLKQAELRLDPPHLGSVNVRITMVDDQAQLAFQAQHPAAREALESALPKLREMFNQEGLELSDADIFGDGRAEDSGREAHNNESDSSSDGRGHAGASSALVDAVDSSASGTRANTSLLVDEFV